MDFDYLVAIMKTNKIMDMYLRFSGFSKVPTESRPHIKYERNPPRPGSGQWVPVNTLPDDEVPPPGLGVPRYYSFIPSLLFDIIIM